MTARQQPEQHRQPLLTVGDVARQVGVTRRTLHHYDEIGVVRPSHRSVAGYRLYSSEDLRRLRTVVLWRRLEVPLEEIGAILEEGGDPVAHLRRQREAVMTRLGELTELVRAIDDAVEAEMNDSPVSSETMRELFGEEFDDGMTAAEQRWGDTEAWQESQRRTASYGETEWRRIKLEGDDVQSRLLLAFRDGLAPDAEASTAAAEDHRRHIHRWFYDCSPAMHRGLGDLYVSDPRYMAGYDESLEAEGFSAWVREAFHANAGRQEG